MYWIRCQNVAKIVTKFCICFFFFHFLSRCLRCWTQNQKLMWRVQRSNWRLHGSSESLGPCAKSTKTFHVSNDCEPTWTAECFEWTIHGHWAVIYVANYAFTTPHIDGALVTCASFKNTTTACHAKKPLGPCANSTKAFHVPNNWAYVSSLVFQLIFHVHWAVVKSLTVCHLSRVRDVCKCHHWTIKWWWRYLATTLAFGSEACANQ